MAQREKVDINMYQGDRAKYKFSLFTDDAKTLPYNISSATSVVMSVANTLDSSAVLFSKTIVDGTDGSSFSTGVLYFFFTNAQTALLNRNGKYDIQINFGSNPETACYGDVIVQRQVTPT